MKSEKSIVQFKVIYIPKGINLRDVIIQEGSLAGERAIDLLLNGDFQFVYSRDTEDIPMEDRPQCLVDPEDITTRPFMVFMICGFAGFSEDADYVSGVDYSLDQWPDDDMEYFMQDIYPDMLSMFERHKILSAEYLGVGNEISLNQCNQILYIQVPTLWSYRSWYKRNEYGYEIEFLGILDMNALITNNKNSDLPSTLESSTILST